MPERGPRSAPPAQPTVARAREPHPPIDRDVEVTITWAELREAIARIHYPAIPAWDAEGQARIDRAADRYVWELTR